MALGKLKQFGLMNWCAPSFEAGLQVRTGFNWMFGVPSSDTLLMLNVVPGIFAPFKLKLKLLPPLNPVRFAPLCNWVMPESCQPFTNAPATLLLTGLPNSSE